MPHDIEDIIAAQDRVLHDMGCPKPAMPKQWLRDYFRAMARALDDRQARDDQVRAEERERCVTIAKALMLIDWNDPNSLEVRGAERMKAAIIDTILRPDEHLRSPALQDRPRADGADARTVTKEGNGK